MADDNEWVKLPAEEKCQHKLWKARVAGYEELIKLFRSLDEKSPEFTKYAGLLKKFVTDNNAISQEKAMDAVKAFVENASVASKTCGEVVSGIVAKCFNARPKTKEAGMEIIMLYIEIEKQDVVQESLLEGLENKQPKIVIGCIQALKDSLSCFGNKIMPIKPVLKFIPKLLEDRDKTVRDETKQLVIEIYRWIGAALKPQMSNFNPIQVQEFEAEFEKMPNKKPQQTRFLRSQQDLKAKMEEQAAGDGVDAGEGNDEGGADDIDPFELMEAVNILPLIPKDFYEKVEAKKWQERKEALEALQKLTENLRIEPGDFQPVVKVLLKVIGKDTNVMLVALGGKILTGLANGLRKEFKQYAQQCFSVLLEKFKEKKAMVVTALRESLDAVYASANLEMITEDCLASLDNKNPSIKAEATLFLSRCFARCTTATLPKKILKTFCAALTKGCNDTAPEVREASFEALGVAMKVVTEKNIAPFLTDVEQIKMQRIQEFCQKAVLLNAKGEPRSGGGAPAPSAPKAGSTEPKPVQRPGTAAASSAPPKAGPGGDRPKTAPPKSGGPPKKTGGPPKGKGKGPKKGTAAAKGAEECSEVAISDEAAEEKAATFLQADVMNQLASANWKERLAAMENFTEVVKKMDRDQIPCQVFVRIICKKPGLKETNFQVLKLKIDLVAHLASNSQFTVRSAEVCLCDLVDKVGDVKNGSAVQEALSCISEAVSLDYVSLQILTMAFEQKNPKNQSEALVWLSKAIKEFGLKVNVKAMIQTIKKAFEATNVAVRNAAISLVATIYMYMGQQLRMFFEDEKPALLQQIDAEIEKVKDEKPPVPTRAYRPAGAADDEDEEEEAEKGEGETEEENVNDLIPRTDVGDQFTEELMTMMVDKNWKVRGEALQKVISILNSAKFVTANLGPLPEALKTRLNDNNKILVTTAIGICVTLATSLGPHCKAHVKIIAPALIGCLTDTKPTLRSVTIGALNAWIDNTTLLPLVEAEILSEALKNENPFLRQELLGWLAERLPNHKPLPAELKMCIPHLLNCLEDRNADVRKKAQDALVPFMIHVGYESVFKATNKLKPASKESVLQIIEKAKANLPAKPPPKAKKAVEAAVPAPAPPAHTKKAASVPPPVEDDEETEKPPTKSSSSENLDKEKKKPGPGKSKPKSAPAPSSKRKKEEEDTSPPMTLTISKEQRFKDEKNMKVLKWNFVEPRAEFVEQLKLQMEKNFNKTLMDQLFHTDFKFHIKAIEKLMQCIPSHQDETVGNLDMILKWFTLRFFDTNPSMLNKALEYLQGMFTMLSEVDYHLTDLEANSFVPYLIIKVGENKDNVRREVRNIFKLIYNVYPASKMFVFISDGLKCKNAKQRQECLEELGFMIEQYGISICQPNPSQALKLIASQIGDRDNGVRNASLNSMVSAFTILGEGIFKHIGTLSDKDQSLLDERIKRSAKNKPPPPPAKEEKPKTAPQQPQRSASQASMQRQSTGIPKSASSNSVKKEFQLEIEKEPSNGSKIEIPKLNQYNLEEIFQPVEYPKIKARPPSPSTKFFNSTDAANSINFVISQITNRDITTSLQALSQIDEVLKDKEKAAEIMASHVEQLLIALSMQFKMVYSTHMGDEQASSEDVVRLYRCLLGTLLALFQNTNLAVRASRDILKDLINNLVTILLDNRLVELEEGPQVIRTVNVMVVKIVEKSDHTNILSALVRLLQECVGSETCTSKFLELIMKCIWRMVRMFPDIVNDLNLDRILYDTHLFLKAFPAISWKDRPNDQPLRTIKTILHSLTVLKGPKILTHLEQVDGPSDVKIYVQKVLKSENKLHSNEEINGSDESKTPKSASKSKRLSKTTHDMLAEIFKKIGSKENTLEGLNDLYDFKKKYPDADIEPFLKKSSQFFQNYIERGLSNIEKEREGQKGKGSSSSVDGPVMISTTTMTTTVTSRPAPLGDVKGDADYYMERLRILRARCGLDNSEPPASENQSQPVTKSELLPFQKSEEEERNDENKEESTLQVAPTSTVDVSELKARLERIKKLAKS
ncbi:hypothetical protein ACJMK2_020593 [Sinanodonta woodiana]|uniref:TOG domain-containing protein n=1 Tax=Sinanodonta woodiana TaxID=1069815 RepID=A0ABD3TZX2_SINWO